MRNAPSYPSWSPIAGANLENYMGQTYHSRKHLEEHRAHLFKFKHLFKMKSAYFTEDPSHFWATGRMGQNWIPGYPTCSCLRIQTISQRSSSPDFFNSASGELNVSCLAGFEANHVTDETWAWLTPGSIQKVPKSVSGGLENMEITMDNDGYPLVN